MPFSRVPRLARAGLVQVWRHLPWGIGWTLAAFTTLNLLGELFHPRFDANDLWMPLPSHGWWGIRMFFALFAALLMASLVRPP